MTNHPSRTRGPYTAEMFGGRLRRGPVAEFATIRACRDWAEEFGRATGNLCVITDRHGNRITEHRLDPSGDGMRWFRATV
jgi:hypothetical protein